MSATGRTRVVVTGAANMDLKASVLRLPCAAVFCGGVSAYGTL